METAHVLIEDQEGAVAVARETSTPVSPRPTSRNAVGLLHSASSHIVKTISSFVNTDELEHIENLQNAMYACIDHANNSIAASLSLAPSPFDQSC